MSGFRIIERIFPFRTAPEKEILPDGADCRTICQLAAEYTRLLFHDAGDILDVEDRRLVRAVASWKG